MISNNQTNWGDTESLYRVVEERAQTFPPSDTIISTVADKLEEALADKVIPASDSISHVGTILRRLYEAERDDLIPAPFNVHLVGTLEGARYRDELLSLIRRTAPPNVSLICSKLTLLTLRFFNCLPPSCYADEPPSSTARLIDHARNVAAFIEMTIDDMTSEIHPTIEIFSILRRQLQANVEAQKGKRPSEFKGSSSELVKAYLRNTPLEDLFDATVPFGIPEHFRAEHTHILGPSGSGKTTLIQQLILADLATDDPPGMVIIDPKGLMVERLQSLDVFNPDTGRLKDRLIVIDPTYEPPPALNMFHAASRWNQIWSVEQRRRVETQVINTFAFVFSSTGSKLTDKQSVPFSYAVRLMFGMESNIHTLIDLMDDPTRTDDPKGQPYSQCRFAPFIGRLDATSERFFSNEFFSSNYRETRQQIKARIYGVLQHPEFVRMFEARKRKLDMLDCLQNKSIVLVNTGMNTLGSDASQLLGRYMISLTLNAAYARFTLPRNEWHQAHLIIDEFQEFADEEKTPELLRLAREYNLAVTMAHQEMHGSGMTEKIRSAVSTNTTIKYASSPEGVDLSYVARDLRCEPSFLTARSKTSTEARFACFVRGFTQHPFVHAAPFGEINRQPQMSREALGRMLRANAERLSLQELPSKPLPPAFQPPPTPVTSQPKAAKPVKPPKPPEDDGSIVSTDW